MTQCIRSATVRVAMNSSVRTGCLGPGGQGTWADPAGSLRQARRSGKDPGKARSPWWRVWLRKNVPSTIWSMWFIRGATAASEMDEQR